MHHIQVSIPVPSQQEAEMLIALLAEEGYEGFEEQATTLNAYVTEDRFTEERLAEILAPFNLGYSITNIAPQNWNKLWESNFEPVTVEDFVAVRASFHAPFEGVQHEIVITPKMSFGTGHHATTYMMMSAMRTIDLTGKTVFDFGTGTGILAILAEKCGAASVLAIDNDEWCITNAQENVEQNNCSKITVQQAERVPGQSFQVILANINRNILLENMQPLAAALAPGGKLLLSGLLQEDETAITQAATENMLSHQSTILRDKWICMLFNGPTLPK